MEELKFYDVKTRKSFTSKEYEIKINKKGMRYAVAKTPSGSKAFRIIGKK